MDYILALTALFAVIASPLVTWIVGSQQSKTSIEIANQQVNTPIQTEWINSLRKLVSEMLSTTIWYYISSQDDKVFETGDDCEFDKAAQQVERKLHFISAQIELLLDTENDDHNLLLKELNVVSQNYAKGGSLATTEFFDAREMVINIFKRIAKNESRNYLN